MEPESRKNGSISEGDLSVLLQRYSAKTIVKLLQEVAQYADEKIDWDALANTTSTGISNVKEYQMVWRYLAYRHPLLDKIEDDAKPLDDDSDLEYDVEASPSVTHEESIEAAAYAKLLIASALPSDPNVHDSPAMEAPLIINIPHNQPSNNSSGNSESSGSMQGKNIAIAVSVQKQSALFATSMEGLDANALTIGSLAGRRKRRKPWSDAEDLELLAAVKKCGEGNWANILRSDFKGDRTASQLYQRWSIIRRKHNDSNSSKEISNMPRLSEAQLAARRAMSMALNMPLRNPTGGGSFGPKPGHPAPASTDALLGGSNALQPRSENQLPSQTGTIYSGASTALQPSGEHQMPPRSGAVCSGDSKDEHQMPSQIGSNDSQPRGENQIPPQTGAVCPAPTTARLAPRKMPSKTSYSPDSMVKAAAVAAGARIVPRDDAAAASVLRSASAVHMMRPAGGALVKYPLLGKSNSTNPNIHFIRTAKQAVAMRIVEDHGDPLKLEEMREDLDEKDNSEETDSVVFNASDQASCEGKRNFEEPVEDVAATGMKS